MDLGLDHAGAAPGTTSPAPRAIARLGRPAARLTWTHGALAAIALVSAFLGLFRLDREGDANTYYAAAVRSMMDNWHAFFFASFDRAGFVTIDKPAFSFWIQTAFAKVLGFHGWSILLPQVLAAVGSVIVIFFVVRRGFGPIAGLVAALALAIAPINVAVARNNTPDGLLVFFLLLAAWAVLIAAERGELRWLVLGMALAGVGFNIKMLEAYLVVPALILTYLVTPVIRLRRRIWHLIVGGIALLVVSFSWATVVQLIPASDRPYIGSSGDNNIFNLIFGYNGINRLLPRGWSIFGITNSNLNLNQTGGFFGGGVGGVSENGPQGILRLLNQQLGGQIGWLLPLAVIGFFVAWIVGTGHGGSLRPVTTGDEAEPSRWRSWLRIFQIDRGRLSLVLWGGWLVTEVGFFSVAGFWHRYYLSILSPAVAALVGAAAVALWHAYRLGSWRLLFIPVALVVTAFAQLSILRDYSTWEQRLRPVIIGLTALAIVGLAIGLALRSRCGLGRWLRMLMVAGIAALLIAPAVWSGVTVASVNGGSEPVAGPRGSGAGFGFGGGGGRRSFNPADLPAEFQEFRRGDAGDASRRTDGGGGGGALGFGRGAGVDSGMLSYLLANQGHATYLVAVRSAMEAAPIILETNKAVMAMGGFSGSDPILTLSRFQQLVQSGQLRFVLANGFGGGFGGGGRGVGGGAGASSQINDWVQQSCKAVPASAYGGSTAATTSGFGGGGSLYDCRGASQTSTSRSGT